MKDMDIQVPNLDFANKENQVSISFVKKDGGFFMRENFSGMEYGISHIGQVHGIINNGIGANMLTAVDDIFTKAKKGEVITLDFQIRKGQPFMLSGGIIALGRPEVQRHYYSNLMQNILYVLQINPSILGGKKYKPTNEGFAVFISDVKKNASDPTKGVIGNFFGNQFGSPFGTHNDFNSGENDFLSYDDRSFGLKPLNQPQYSGPGPGFIEIIEDDSPSPQGRPDDKVKTTEDQNTGRIRHD